MKCYELSGEGLENIKLVQRPAPSIINEYDVLIDVKACSLNYRDLMVAKGLYSPGTFPPFILLSDMAGVVKEVGSKVVDLKPGDRVLNAPFKCWPAGTLKESWANTFVGGRGVDGVLAEQIVYPVDALVKIPDHLDFIEASTFTIAGLTAWSAIVTHGKTSPGEWVLLQGTGGVSIFAAQLAQAMGAQIIMTSSNQEKAKFVKNKFGLHATVDYHDKNWHKQVKELTQGAGVDVVVDVAGGETLTQSLQICNYGARVAVVGVLSGTDSKLQIRDLLKHQVQIRGIFMESTEELRKLMKAVEYLKLKPHIDKTFHFDNALEAYRHLESQKHIGKIVIAF